MLIINRFCLIENVRYISYYCSPTYISLQASILPTVLDVIAAWLPASEMQPFSLIFVSHNIGSGMGVAITATLLLRSGQHPEHSFELAFYLSAAICFVAAIGWMFLVFDTPANHPRIAEEEQRYLAANADATVRVGTLNINLLSISFRASALTKTSYPIPLDSWWPSLGKLCMAPPFWALLCMQWSNAWFGNFVLTGLPLFVHYGLGIEMSTASVCICAMYLSRVVFCLLFGLLAEQIVAADWISKTVLRKLASLMCAL